MFVTKKFLPRRTFLQGMGVAVSLPLLDAMVPAFTALARRAGASAHALRRHLRAQRRHHGAVDPRDRGRRVRLQADSQADRDVQGSDGRRHQPDAVASGQPGGRPRGERRRIPHRRVAEAHRGRGRARQHDASIRSWRSRSVRTRRSRRLEVATEDFTGYVGACSPGFNCAYLNTVSWSSPSTPLPMDINPRVVFERMFGQAGSPAQRAARIRDERSMLDSVSAEARQLQRGLGARDRQRVSRVSRQPARDRAAHPARRVAQRRPNVTLDDAGGRARLVRGSRRT